MADLTGQVLAERYHIQEFLGRGGMAEVYKAWDARRMTALALKVLHEDLALDRVFLRRFQREAQTLEKLQHPHIVRFYGLEQDGRLQFMLMDFVAGLSLRQRIFDAAAPLPAEEVGKIFTALCSALQFAHSEGMVHCDIKPANIMLHNNGTVLLADFGISRMVESSTTTTLGLTGSGTPAYMAPEQARGETPTAQTDIYALGIVLYELLTGGERPFTGELARITGSTIERVRWEHLHVPPPSPRQYNPAISPELEAVVLKCLEKEPAQRYASAFELLVALERALGGDARETAPASQATAIQPPRVPAHPPQTTVLPTEAQPRPEQRYVPAAAPMPRTEAAPATPRRSLGWLWGLVILIPVGLGLLYAGQAQPKATPPAQVIVITATSEAAALDLQAQPPEATMAPLAAADTAQPSSTPSATSTPTATPQPTDTPAPTATATATAQPRAVVQDTANCRKGPATNYAIVFSPQAGEAATITGVSGDQGWLWVDFRERNMQCWISATVVSVQGERGGLPVFTPPPTPRPTDTPVPTNTVVVEKADLSCQAWLQFMFSVNKTKNATFTFENDSNVAAGSFTIRLRYEGLTPDEGNNREFRVQGVGANRATTSITVPTTFSSTGTVRTYCEVDVYNEVPEYNENNNVYYGTESVN